MTPTPNPARDAGDGRAEVPACDAGAVLTPANDPNDTAVSLARIHDAARAAIARGWAVIPLRPREKAPATAHDWGHLTISTEQVARHFTLLGGKDGARAAPNLGVLTGGASGGLVDVDSDTREAVALAEDLLPPTGRISGHQSHPASHLWYRGMGSASVTRLAFQGVATPTQPAAMLIELRGDGHQTMIPPSIHPSGEPVVWARDGEPARVDLAVLRAGVATVAAGAQIARAWPAVGLRDEAALALCGMLARGGWDAERIDRFVCAVARAAGDEEWTKRGKGAHTHAQVAAGAKVTGGPKLAELLGAGHHEMGRAIVAKVREWLELKDDAGSRPRGPAPSVPLAPLAPLGERGKPTPIADVQALPVDAWFGGRIYGGMLNILDGDPGLGKTNVALYCAAVVSTGGAFPDGSPFGPPAAVLYFTAEDDVARTLKPRLAAAGANQHQMYAYTTVRYRDAMTGNEAERLPTLRDLDWLAEQIELTQARLVIFDPLVAFLPAGVSANRDQDMRAVLTPLAALAERTGAAFLFIRHLNKSGMGRAMYRGGGAIGITGAVRSALLVGRDPSDPERLVLASNKNNLGPTPVALGFEIVGEPGSMPVVRWKGPVPYTADMLLSDSDGAANRGEKMEAATEFLTTELAGGPVPEATIQAKARAADIARRTLRRAKHLLGVRSIKREDGAHSGWLWILPQDDQPPPEEPQHVLSVP